MIPGNFVSADHIVEAFREDHEVLKVCSRWPDTAFERIDVLRQANRPVGNILRYPWRLYFLDRNELLTLVYPVWPKPSFANHSWTLKEMTDAMQLGTFPVPSDVTDLETKMRASFRPIDPLIGYNMPTGRIHLEDGNNRVTAAIRTKLIPSITTMYLAEVALGSPNPK
jgi:hypothetical protein